MQLSRKVPMMAALAVLTAVPGFAQEHPARGVPFESYELDNGMAVILAPDRGTPVVAVNVWYDVGSSAERKGKTGFAHLFEHMMFQGSQNVGKGQHMTLIDEAGGTKNASTNDDYTNYFETLPANRLNLGLWLEADRMRSLAITQENFDNQREVVKEERRLKVDNAPYTAAFLRALYGAVYNPETCYSYAQDGFGIMEDLNASELAEVQAFFDAYYAPNNATLAVVGDFDPAEARAMIQEYFGGIPSRPTREKPECREPFSKLPNREVVNDRNAQLPAVMVSYGIVPENHADAPALTLLRQILSSGESSRLHQRLVKGDQVAVDVGGFSASRRGPAVSMVYAIANQGVTVERLESLLSEEVEKISRDGVTAAELGKAKNRYRANTIRGRQTAMGRAEALQHFNHFYGDPAAVNTDLDRYMAVTRDDIRRVATRYMTPNNRAVVVAQPAPAAKEGE